MKNAKHLEKFDYDLEDNREEILGLLLDWQLQCGGDIWDAAEWTSSQTGITVPALIEIYDSQW